MFGCDAVEEVFIVNFGEVAVAVLDGVLDHGEVHHDVLVDAIAMAAAGCCLLLFIIIVYRGKEVAKVRATSNHGGGTFWACCIGIYA